MSVPLWLIQAYMVLRISYKLCAISALIYKIYLRLISTYTTADNALYHTYTISYTSALVCGHTLNCFCGCPEVPCGLVICAVS